MMKKICTVLCLSSSVAFGSWKHEANEDFKVNFYVSQKVSTTSISAQVADGLDQEFRVGEEVELLLNGGFFEVVITQVFENGTARVRYVDGTTSIYPTTAMRHILTSLKGFNKGEKVELVLEGVHYDSIILHIFDDETAKLKLTDGTIVVSSLSFLTHLLSSLKGFEVGESVKIPNGHSVVILQIFGNENVRIRYADGTTEVYPISSLVKETFEE